jgi:hypothetical protein
MPVAEQGGIAIQNADNHLKMLNILSAAPNPATC